MASGIRMLAKAAGIAAPARAKHAQQLDGTIIWEAEVVHARRAWRREAGGRGGAGRGLEPPGALGHHAADGDDGVLEDGRFSALRAVQQRRGGLHLSAGAGVSLQRRSGFTMRPARSVGLQRSVCLVVRRLGAVCVPVCLCPVRLCVRVRVRVSVASHRVARERPHCDVDPARALALDAVVVVTLDRGRGR